MDLKSLCQRQVVSIDERASLVQAARLMREHHVGALVVTTQGPQGTWISGIVTDRDIVIEGLAAPGVGPDTPVGSLATKTTVHVNEDASVTDAITAMGQAGVRRLLIVDREQHLAGVVSLDDLLRAFARDAAGLAEALRVGAQRESETAATPPPPAPRLRVPAMGTAGWKG
jgi:CBS domain-containing protein